MRSHIDHDLVTPDAPLRLEVAARLAFPDGSITAASLRREAGRGRLTVWRIAGKYMTTLSAITEMVTRCRVPQSQPGYGSDQPPTIGQPHGSSSMADGNTARIALQLRVEKLKQS